MILLLYYYYYYYNIIISIIGDFLTFEVYIDIFFLKLKRKNPKIFV